MVTVWQIFKWTAWKLFKWTTFILPATKALIILPQLYYLPLGPGIIEDWFFVVAESSTNVWMISRIINNPCCTSASFFGLIRCWLKPNFLSLCIMRHFDIFHALFYERIDWVTISQFDLSIMNISLDVFPELASITFVSLSARVVVLIVDTVADQIIARNHRHDQAPTIHLPADSYWEVVTILKSTNNGYGAQQFYAATICDLNKYDDPFWPEHNSILCVVEVRRRNMIWKTITLWQVSMLNGGKKKIHEFRYISYETDGRIFLRRGWGLATIKSFQSGVVVFVYISDSPATLFVYDMRFGKSATYEFHHFEVRSLISMTCAGRFISTNGKVEGWRLQLLKSGEERCNCPNHNENGFRSVIETITYDLREKASVRGSQQVVFGRCQEFIAPRRRHLRTSDGSFGLQILDTPIENDGGLDGPSIIYNSGTQTFRLFPNFQALIQFDRPLGAYFYTPSPRNPLSIGDGYSNLCPPILSRSECIESHNDGAIFRTKFKPPTLRYLQARNIFRRHPNLRQEGAEGFRRLTGIDGMEGHFDR